MNQTRIGLNLGHVRQAGVETPDTTRNAYRIAACPTADFAHRVFVIADSEPSKLARDYWLRARRPLSSIVFLLPLLVIYEAGLQLVGATDPDAVRNGADYWMRGGLAMFGLSNSLLLPLILVFGLFSWHVFRGDPWRVRTDTMVGMFAESVLFAGCLFAIGQVHNAMFASLPEIKELAVAASPSVAIPTPLGSRVVSFIGAGVYEEVLFRLCLLPCVYGGCRLFGISPRASAITSAAATGLVFAAAHHIGPAADTFSLFTFSFRTIAGVFFAGLFFTRGFGITVGAHAAYDLLVGVLFASAGS